MIRSTALAIAVVWSFSASAQMSLPSFGKSSGGSGGAATTAEQVVKEYVAAHKEVLGAQSKLAEALGLKDEAKKFETAAASINEGATKDGFVDSEKSVGDSGKTLTAAMKAKTTALDAGSKAKYAEGLANLGKGVMKYAGLKSTLSGYKPSMTSLGASANAAGYVMTSAPEQMSALGTTFGAAMDFAKSNDIPIPTDATAALGKF